MRVSSKFMHSSLTLARSFMCGIQCYGCTQIPQQPNGAAQDTLANGKRKRPRAQKPTEASHQSNGTSGPAAG